jgi:hypothetical protein
LTKETKFHVDRSTCIAAAVHLRGDGHTYPRYGDAIVRTPTDIFPNINIPVVSIIWNYNGPVPEDMSNRIVSVTERSLTTTVDNIEHIESQSLYGIAVVKVLSRTTGDMSPSPNRLPDCILRELPGLSRNYHSLVGPGFLSQCGQWNLQASYARSDWNAH